MFADAIRQAKNEHEIYFLLTAYVESARYCDPLNLLPPSVKQLPLGGIEHVSAQYQQLVIELDRASKGLDQNACLVLKEALHVFSIALDRLPSLDAMKAQPMPDRRKGERRRLVMKNEALRAPQTQGEARSESNRGNASPVGR